MIEQSETYFMKLSVGCMTGTHDCCIFARIIVNLFCC